MRLCLSENDRESSKNHRNPGFQCTMHHGKDQALSQCIMGWLKLKNETPLDPSNDPLRTSLVLVSLVPKSARARLGTRQEGYIAVHSNTRLNIALYSPPQLYIALHSYTQPSTAMHSPTQPYMALHSHTSPSTAIHDPI